MFSWYEKMMFRLKTGQELWNDVQIFRFFESPSKRGLRVGIALALILLGMCGFMRQIDDVAALEEAKQEPIVVDALLTVVSDGHGGYNKLVSYSYDGVDYERVFYYSTENHYAKKDDGETIRVMLNPRNHGQLTRNIVNEMTLNLPLISMALGLGLFSYCACLGNSRIRSRLVRIASGRDREQDQPDYLVDLLFMATLILMLMGVILWIMFPLAAGCGYVAAALQVLGFGVVFRYSIWRYGWRSK